MNKVKKYLRKILKILKLKELQILPAYLSYNLVLALIPILTIIVIVAGFFSVSMESVVSLINDILPSYASRVVIPVITGREFDLSVGFLNIVTLVVASNGAYAIIRASNSLYKIDDSSEVKDRIRSFVILLVIICLILFLVLVPMFGERILALLKNYKVFSHILDEIIIIYKILKWPVTFLVIFLNIKIIYMIAPSKRMDKDETTIGAFVTTVMWVIFTMIFGYYIKYFARYDLIYGSLSSITILLIWLYVLSFILVLGIVINTIKYNKH